MPRKQKIRFNVPVGSYKLVGEPVAFPSNETLSAVTGSFILAGPPVSFQVVNAPFILANTADFVLTGNDAQFNVNLNSSESTGLFALTAPDASFQIVNSPFIIADTVDFVLTGNDAVLTASVNLTLNADTGFFQVITTNSSVDFIISVAQSTPFSIGVFNNMLPPGPYQIGVRQSMVRADAT